MTLQVDSAKFLCQLHRSVHLFLPLRVYHILVLGSQPGTRRIFMAGVKRKHHGMESNAASSSDDSKSPFIPIFETFRAELDEHHDRRERIVKVSRDVTAQSKKM